MKQTMEAKKYLVSFLVVLATVFVLTTVSADNLADVTRIDVDGTTVYENGAFLGNSLSGSDLGVSVEAGQTIEVEVWFTARIYDGDVTVSAELDGNKVDVKASTKPFDVEWSQSYKKTLTLKVPYELKDELSDNLELDIKIDGNERKTEVPTITLRVQRTSYDVAIKSVSVDQSIKAGETFPVELVLKNIGYNDLDGLYVTAKITTLGVQKSGYFGDLVALECDNSDDNEFPWSDTTLNRKCNEDNVDTISGKLMLEVPFGTKAGTYNLEVVVENDDTTSTKTVEVVLQNDFDKTVFKSGNSIWLVNPTDNVVGYRLVAESPASVAESIVFVPAGASKTVAVEPNAEGEYDFNVNVFTLKGEVVDSINFSGSTTEKTDKATQTSPIVILTVVLAIIFIVLLIVLIVLIGKKPEKSGEFGESYY
jgi:hypothetical protein